jgi:hypothetical protein
MKKKRSAESCGNVGDQSSICLREQQPTKHIRANKSMGRNGRKEQVRLSRRRSHKKQQPAQVDVHICYYIL